MVGVLRRYENIVYQARHGNLDPESWEGMREHLKYVFTQPGAIAWWKRAPTLFNRQLQEFMEKEIL